MADVAGPLVEIDGQYLWARQQRQETATQTARIEDAKAAQARADAALKVYHRALVQPALDAAAAEQRARERRQAQRQQLLARQREDQATAQRGAQGVSSASSRAWDNLRLRSSFVRQECTPATARTKSHGTRRQGLRADRPLVFQNRQSKSEIVDQLAQEIESRVRPDATVEWALRAPLPTAEQWRPPRSFITREGTDGDPFVWIAARKASAAPEMHNRQSQRAGMSAEEKRDRREMGVTMARHRACMEELLKLKRTAERHRFWAETMAPFSVSEKTIEAHQARQLILFPFISSCKISYDVFAPADEKRSRPGVWRQRSRMCGSHLSRGRCCIVAHTARWCSQHSCADAVFGASGRGGSARSACTRAGGEAHA